jgi:hypothetical protein
MNRFRYVFDDGADEAMELAFKKTSANARKEWICANLADPKPEPEGARVPISEFVHAELVQFSIADVQRSIPSAIDGLKPSQRKILHVSMQRLESKELKVTQLAAAVAENTSYKHGEDGFPTFLSSCIVWKFCTLILDPRMPPLYEGNLGTVRANTGVFNNLQSGYTSQGLASDLTITSAKRIILDPNQDVRISTDFIVEWATSLGSNLTNAFLGTRLIESLPGLDLILRPGDLARVVIDGDLAISGGLTGFNLGSNNIANVLLMGSNAVVLGTDIYPNDDKVDGGGILLRGLLYDADPRDISFTWNENTSNIPYWEARGGNLKITRTLGTGSNVSYFLSIGDDLALGLVRQIGSNTLEPVIGFAPAYD